MSSGGGLEGVDLLPVVGEGAHHGDAAHRARRGHFNTHGPEGVCLAHQKDMLLKKKK